jgi:hypothetical protein
MESPYGRPNKKSRIGMNFELGQVHNPSTKYRNHKDSGVGEDFHSVPYPLSLMPYDSWYLLHHLTDLCEDRQFVCPKCKEPRPKPTPHQRKLFLVAERLSWEDGIVPTRDKDANQEQLWEVNFELGITEPVIEDPNEQPGGRESRKNPFFPFETEDEMNIGLNLLSKAECLSEDSFQIWRTTLNAMPELPDTAETPLGDLSEYRTNAVDYPRSSNGNTCLSSNFPPSIGGVNAASKAEESQVLAHLTERARKQPAITRILEANVRGDATEVQQRILKDIENEKRESLRVSQDPPASSSRYAPIGARQLQMFQVRYLVDGRQERGQLPFSELSPVICNRLEELVIQRHGESSLALRRVKEGTADKFQHRSIQILINWLCDELINQHITLEEELERARRISDISIRTGWQNQFPQTRQQAGGVAPQACHLILARTTFDPLLDRLLMHLGTVPYTTEQQGLFCDVIGLFEWFLDASRLDFRAATEQLMSHMQSVDVAIMKTLQKDSCFRIVSRSPHGTLHWTAALVQAACLRSDPAVRTADYSVLPHAGRTSLPTPGLTPIPAPHAIHGTVGSSTLPVLVNIVPTQKAPAELPLKSRKLFSIDTLPEFYSVLDKIERTSYVASRYLETYAEFLNRDVCTKCWHEVNILGDDDFGAWDDVFGFFADDKENRMVERAKASCGTKGGHTVKTGEER